MDFDETYANLSNAVELALEKGMTENEVRECVDNAIDNCVPDEPFVGGGPKPKKKDE